MKAKYKGKINKVTSYFNTKESRWGYSLLLKGTKHFGFYPRGKENISMKQAQLLMEEKLAKKLNLPTNSIILDAGSGEGNVAIHLAEEFGYRIEGVDLLPFAVNIAKKKARIKNLVKRVHFQIGDYTYLNFPDNFFDGVYTMETLVHVPDYKKTLKEFYRILKPNGKLILFEYSILPQEYATAEEGYFWNLIVEGSAMHSLPYFTHGKFPEILKEAGFKKIEVDNITKGVIPMLKMFYRLAYLPYQLIKIFRAQRKFVNATAAIWLYKTIKKDSWRYNIITTIKK